MKKIYLPTMKIMSRVTANNVFKDGPVAVCIQPMYAEWNLSLLSIGLVYFCFKGCWVVLYPFYSNFDRRFCKQLVETMIRPRV